MAMSSPPGAPALSRRTRLLVVIGGVIVLVLLLGSSLLSVYLDWLWFGSVGFRAVYATVLGTRGALFLVVALAFGVLLSLTLRSAYRARPMFLPVSGTPDSLARLRTLIMARPRVFAVGVSVLVGLCAGLAAQGDWQTAQMFLHTTSFGTTDPVFGMDISFYAFELPFYRWVVNLLFAATALCFGASLLIHYIFGGVRPTGRAVRVSVPARAHLALLAGVFVLLKAVAYWLDRYSLLLSPASHNGGVFGGASYTDLNAVIPAKIILTVIAVICAVTLVVGAFQHTLQLPAIAIALMVLSSVLVGGVWPAVLQQLVVRPNANVRESVPIQRNIEATQAAFGLTPAKVTYVPYSGRTDATGAQVGADTATISNLRLLDPSKLSKTFTQLEQRKNFYGFPERLNIDRYRVNGRVRDYVVAARELDSGALTANQTNWINQHMVYTHGNGFVAAPANQVNSALDDAGGGQGGYPNFTVSDTNTKGDIPVSQPRIYYGRMISGYSIVGAGAHDAPREYDTDTDQSTYAGSSGVSVGNPVNRLAFALAYGEQNIVFNSSINANSKILYVRDPSERLSRVAPWLTVDSDPYPAVVDGRIQWILDGYTTLGNYPYAEHVRLGDATADFRPGVAAEPNLDVSYVRNSVKATVDAYDGTVTLYAVDDKDPVLQTWMKVFPGTVRPGGDISPELRAHFRYPQDQFKVQRELLTRYHVTNPAEFFSTVSFWNVPSDPTVIDAEDSAPQPPYYVLAGLPGQDGASFQLTTPLVSLQRPFLAAYVSAASDPATYGHLTVLQLPTDTQTPGPQQAQNQFVSMPQVSQQLNLLKQNQTSIDYGNLLTLPVAGGLLYMEPIYIERANQDTSFPQLAKVLVGFGGKIGYDARLDVALGQVFGPETAGPAAAATPLRGSPSASAPADPQLDGAVSDIGAALHHLRASEQSGDFTGAGAALADLDKAAQRFRSGAVGPWASH